MLAALAGVVVGLYAATLSFAVVNEDSNPQIALRLYPQLPTATAKIADLRIFAVGQRILKEKGPTPGGALPPSLVTGIGLDLPAPDRIAVARLVTQTLRASALSSPALRQMAYLEDDAAKRRQLLRLAERVTRRDVLATLQKAELDIRDGKIEDGLAGINRALVVSRTVDSAVFPMLLGVVGINDQLAGQVRGLLSRDPPWSERLLTWAIANPAYLPTLSKILAGLPGESRARAVGYGQQIVDLLVGQRRYPEAFAAYRAFAPSEPNLDNLTRSSFPPIDWKLIGDYEAGARAFNRKGVEVFANSRRRGEVANVLANLAPGPAQLRFGVQDTIGQGATLRLTVLCLLGNSERVLAERRVALTDGSVRLPFAVPSTGCDYQSIRLAVSAEAESASALISAVSLDREITTVAP